MNVLVTGGAGYLGSQTVRALLRSGHRVVVLDNLSTGHRRATPPQAEFAYGDVGDESLVTHILQQNKIQAVMHFAGLIEVCESVRDPAKYYTGNFARTLTLLQTMIRVGVKRMVFPSSATVYGEIGPDPLREDHLLRPINPYGSSKMMIETAMQDFHASCGLDFTVLRCFNVAGADLDGQHGEAHQPESHLIPRVLQGIAQGHATIHIFGTDYPTADGTCVRDYVHIDDLARAHVMALESTASGTGTIFNIGGETGHSVRDVIAACHRITGHPLQVVNETRRAGDPPCLIADSSRIRQELGWRPRFALDDMIQHAWNWHSGHPQGYPREDYLRLRICDQSD